MLTYVALIFVNPLSLRYSLFQIFPNMSSCIVCGLTPYTDYSFKIEACTVIGCSLSESSNIVRTLPDGKTCYEMLYIVIFTDLLVQNTVFLSICLKQSIEFNVRFT